jgi:fatty acid/phospholipid biosynthesis enzyme
MKEQTLKEYEAAPLLGLRSVVVKSTGTTTPYECTDAIWQIAVAGKYRNSYKPWLYRYEQEKK